MKKLILILLAIVLLAFPVGALAAAGVIQGSAVDIGEDRLNSNPIRTITFLITATAGGAIPDTVLTARNFEKVKGWCFRGVEAYPTGGVAPTAASVFILDADGLDLLGSEDGETTAYNGLNLIHATLKRFCYPNLYTPRAGLHMNYIPPVKSLLTLKVTDTAANATITIVLTFSR